MHKHLERRCTSLEYKWWLYWYDINEDEDLLEDVESYLILVELGWITWLL